MLFLIIQLLPPISSWMLQFALSTVWTGSGSNSDSKVWCRFLLLDREAFTLEYVANNTWLKQYQPASAETFTQGIPALSTDGRCSVLKHRV